MTTEPCNDRPACIWDGWCDVGCPLGAIVNPLVICLPPAIAVGAEIEHNNYVGGVLTNPSGDRATAVEIVGWDGNVRVREANVVVLAAFSIQIPRILLSFAADGHPDGLANGRGYVGVGMMARAARSTFGLFADETENFLGAVVGPRLAQDGCPRNPERTFVGGWNWLSAGALKPNDLLGIANT